MELDVIKASSPRGKGKQHQRKSKALTCYACGKSGHMARNCRMKNMVSRPQLNMMTGKQGESSQQRNPGCDDPKLNDLMAIQARLEEKIAQRIQEIEFEDYGEGEDDEEEEVISREDADWETE
ncbi:hypothetical protein N7G274_010478 [Stereocaulon virgatum]|uniref:CCHC-type domain-containing protein n=1 Tax=Stereocaulon virgatum TaxID=373712 RepID=A0ABR3ZW57_9LECA